jgi:hypothetical protein
VGEDSDPFSARLSGYSWRFSPSQSRTLRSRRTFSSQCVRPFPLPLVASSHPERVLFRKSSQKTQQECRVPHAADLQQGKTCQAGQF